MKRRLALVVAASAIAAPVAWAAPTRISVPASVVKHCSGGYTLAHLSWGDKCLRAGEFCKVGNREYLRYGFYCPASRHLRRR
jgi:hypothetical protein